MIPYTYTQESTFIVSNSCREAQSKGNSTRISQSRSARAQRHLAKGEGHTRPSSMLAHSRTAAAAIRLDRIGVSDCDKRLVHQRIVAVIMNIVIVLVVMVRCDVTWRGKCGIATPYA